MVEVRQRNGSLLSVCSGCKQVNISGIKILDNLLKSYYFGFDFKNSALFNTN